MSARSAEWLAWFVEADDAYTRALDRQADAVWAGTHMSHEYADAALEVTRTRARWQERLVAYNAYMEANASAKVVA
jgi:hypothetical protein